MTALTVLHCWELDGDWTDAGSSPINLTDSSFGSPSWSSGRVGLCRSAAIEVGVSQGYRNTALTDAAMGDFTAGLWWWFDPSVPQETESGPSISIWTGDATWGYVILGFTSLGTSSGELWPSVNPGQILDGTGAVMSPHGWVHVVWVRQGATISTYINGQLVRYGAWTTNGSTSEAGFFVPYSYNSDAPVKLDQIFLDNTAFDQAKIDMVYNAGAGRAYSAWTVPEAPVSSSRRKRKLTLLV